MKSPSSEAVLCEGDHRGALALSGALVFATAAQAYEDAGRALRGGSCHRLDLGGVIRADSAGLACVLALLAQASRSGRALRVCNLPESLRALAEVCDACGLLATA